MRLGLSYGVGRREPLERVPRIAQLVEEAGFDRLWFVDYQLPMKDSIIAMTLAASATRTLKLGPGVANPRSRHVSILANAMTGINEITKGRALVGIGSGHTGVYGVGLKPTNLLETEIAIRALKALVAGDEADAESGGRRYRLHTITELPTPPVFAAATHEKMLRLAGREADGVILRGAADTEMTRWQLDRIEEGLAESGRNREHFDVELWFALSVGDDESAVADVKAWAAAQARVLNRWPGELPALREFADEMARADGEYELSEHLSVKGKNADLVSDELAGRLAVAGDARTCADRILELADLGVDGFTFSLLSGGREQRIRRLAEELIPALTPRPAGRH
jgi:5,10-methylenetetrahydromethanopterin reductase